MMNKIITAICLLLLSVAVRSTAQGQEKIEDLDIGSKMVSYPKVDWIKGGPVTAFEKDKIYIVELWATWCVPCIQAMPHLNQLYQKFKDKNVVFIGQDVMEEDKAKVEKFVNEKGEGLSYLIAFSGRKGSDFDKRWVEAAGINSIPQTFVIQNNTLVWQTHPNMLNEQILQLLVEGKFTIEAANRIGKKN